MNSPALLDTDSAHLRQRAWRLYFEANGRLHGLLESSLKKNFGLSVPDYNILLALFEAPGQCLKMGELSGQVVYSPSRLTYLVTHLERDGWVKKVMSKEDRRSYQACLTSQGVRIVKEATRLHQETLREFLLADMTDAEISQIVRVFSALDERLRSRNKN